MQDRNRWMPPSIEDEVGSESEPNSGKAEAERQSKFGDVGTESEVDSGSAVGDVSEVGKEQETSVFGAKSEVDIESSREHSEESYESRYAPKAKGSFEHHSATKEGAETPSSSRQKSEAMGAETLSDSRQKSEAMGGETLSDSRQKSETEGAETPSSSRQKSETIDAETLSSSRQKSETMDAETLSSSRKKSEAMGAEKLSEKTAGGLIKGLFINPDGTFGVEKVKRGELIANYFSRFLSILFSPYAVPLYVMLLLFYGNTILAFSPAKLKIFYVVTVFVNTLVLPVLFNAIVGASSQEEAVGDRHRRVLPLVVAAVCFGIAAYVVPYQMLFVVPKNYLISIMVAMLVSAIISLYWQVSVHMVIMGSLVAVLYIITMLGFGQMFGLLILFLILAGLLGSARLYLNRNSLMQVVVGFLLGVTITMVVTLKPGFLGLFFR